MKRAILSLLAIVLCSLANPAALAKDFYTPWYLPWFSKDQHIYICGPVDAYGLTQQQFDELESDLDRLSHVCGVNLYFSVFCSAEMDQPTLAAYTDLLTERWQRNQLAEDNRAVFSICMNPTVAGPGFASEVKYQMTNFDFWYAQEATSKYLGSKPYLYPFINYVTLATEKTAREKMSADQIGKGSLDWQQFQQKETEDRLKAKAIEKARAEDAKAKAPPPVQQQPKSFSGELAGIIVLGIFVVGCIGMMAFFTFFRRKRETW